MNILINGEIYLKRGPEIFQLDEDLKELIENLEFESTKEDQSFFLTESLNNFKSIAECEGEMDYSGCDSFWISNINEFGITLIEQDYLRMIKTYSDEIQLNKAFIKLTDFLDESNYIGRYFKRTALIDNQGFNYLLKDNKILILYATKNIILTKYKDIFKEEFQILPPHFFEDGNFEFYGEYNDEYSNKKLLYKSIVKQIINYNKGKQKRL